MKETQINSSLEKKNLHNHLIHAYKKKKSDFEIELQNKDLTIKNDEFKDTNQSSILKLADLLDDHKEKKAKSNSNNLDETNFDKRNNNTNNNEILKIIEESINEEIIKENDNIDLNKDNEEQEKSKNFLPLINNISAISHDQGGKQKKKKKKKLISDQIFEINRKENMLQNEIKLLNREKKDYVQKIEKKNQIKMVMVKSNDILKRNYQNLYDEPKQIEVIDEEDLENSLDNINYILKKKNTNQKKKNSEGPHLYIFPHVPVPATAVYKPNFTQRSTVVVNQSQINESAKINNTNFTVLGAANESRLINFKNLDEKKNVLMNSSRYIKESAKKNNEKIISLNNINNDFSNDENNKKKTNDNFEEPTIEKSILNISKVNIAPNNQNLSKGLQLMDNKANLTQKTTSFIQPTIENLNKNETNLNLLNNNSRLNENLLKNIRNNDKSNDRSLTANSRLTSQKNPEDFIKLKTSNEHKNDLRANKFNCEIINEEKSVSSEPSYYEKKLIVNNDNYQKNYNDLVIIRKNLKEKVISEHQKIQFQIEKRKKKKKKQVNHNDFMNKAARNEALDDLSRITQNQGKINIMNNENFKKVLNEIIL